MIRSFLCITESSGMALVMWSYQRKLSDAYYHLLHAHSKKLWFSLLLQAGIVIPKEEYHNLELGFISENLELFHVCLTCKQEKL